MTEISLAKEQKPSWWASLQQWWKNLKYLLRRWWHKKFRSVSERRLEAAIRILQAEIDAQKTDQVNWIGKAEQRFSNWRILFTVSLSNKKIKNDHWQELSQQYLHTANKALNNHNPELGWPLFKAAYRAHLYNAPNLQSEANTILHEAKDEKKKLSPWRKESIIGLLSADEGKTVKQPLKPESVVKAQFLLDEQLDNTYYKSAIVKNRLQLLAWTSLIILIAWVIFAPPISVPNPLTGEGGLTGFAMPIMEVPTLASSATRAMTSPRIFWSSLILAGMVGAAISGFTGAIQQDVSKSRIPEELSTSTVTFARLGLAGVSAVAISLFLTSGLINGSSLSYELLLASAVAAGFSEQFLIRALEPKA